MVFRELALTSFFPRWFVEDEPDLDLDSFYETILRLVQEGGAVIRDAINKEKKIDEKSSAKWVQTRPRSTHSG